MLKNKKVLWLLIISLLASVVLTACGGKKTEGGKEAKGDNSEDSELIVAQGADVTSLDPHKSNDQPSARVMRQIYDTLVVFSDDMKIEGNLAEKFTQKDDLTWEFELKKGVKFHNGEELKASDVKYSLERNLESPEVSHIIESISEVNVIDDYKFEIKTSEPFSSLLAHLTHGSTAILNEKVVKEAGENYADKPVGTGPFKFENRVHSETVELLRFDDYFDGPAKSSKIIFKAVPEGANRTTGLESGEISISYEIDPNNKQDVENNDTLTYVTDTSFSYDYLGMNNQTKPFDDPKVRQAISHAVNAQQIIDTVFEGDAEIAYTPIEKDVVGATTDVKKYEYNVEKSKELLKEAGYPDGFEVTITTSDDGPRGRVAEVIQAQLKEVGIDVKVDLIEWASFLKKTSKGEAPMFILGWSATTGDADYGLGIPYTSANAGPGGNRCFYSNEKVDKLFAEARKEKDPETRKGFYVEAQKIIAEDVPNTPLCHKLYNAGIQKTVSGFKIHPSGSHVLKDVYIDTTK